MKKLVITFLSGVLIAACGIASGQDPPAPPDRGGPRGGRGAPVPPEQRMLLQVQNLMGVQQDEWAILEPKIQQIQLLLKQRDRFSKPKPPPPPRPPAREGEPPRPPEPQRDPNLIVDLGPDPNKELQNPSHTQTMVAAQQYAHLAMLASYPTTGQGELSTSLAAYRAARDKADRELATARDDLRRLVTTRQEVLLVVMGILD